MSENIELLFLNRLKYAFRDFVDRYPLLQRLADRPQRSFVFRDDRLG